jgi:RNA-directed DNA polymerase
MEKEMKELHFEGVATHDGPESCAYAREVVGEALTGVRAGGAIEPRNPDDPGRRRSYTKRKATPTAAIARAVIGPCVVEEPMHARNLHAREPGDPAFARPVDHRAGRTGKAEAATL